MTQDVEMKDRTDPSNSVSSTGPSTLHRKYRLKIICIHFKLYATFNHLDLVGINRNKFKI